MHILAREVRFSINPFLPADIEGCNSYCGRPAGEGLAIFLSLRVELVGQVDPDTGFVMNIVDVDRLVRQHAVPVFAEQIRANFSRKKHIDFTLLAHLCSKTYQKLTRIFGTETAVRRITLNLNPFRTLAVKAQEGDMVYFSEKFEFAATHTLWNDKFSEQKNLQVFGKCANRAGHGHNYIVDVTVKTTAGRQAFDIGDFQKTVDSALIDYVDHKNLNVEIPEFASTIPTVENIAVFAWQRLVGRFPDAELHRVKVWESDKTWCSYYGE